MRIRCNKEILLLLPGQEPPRPPLFSSQSRDLQPSHHRTMKRSSKPPLHNPCDPHGLHNPCDTPEAMSLHYYGQPSMVRWSSTNVWGRDWTGTGILLPSLHQYPIDIWRFFIFLGVCLNQGWFISLYTNFIPCISWLILYYTQVHIRSKLYCISMFCPK